MAVFGPLCCMRDNIRHHIVTIGPVSTTLYALITNIVLIVSGIIILSEKQVKGDGKKIWGKKMFIIGITEIEK